MSGLHSTNCARVVKYVSFITFWHKHRSNIKIQPARNDLRDKCDQMLVTLRHSLSDEQCKTINDKYTQHLIKAKAFRDAYNANIEEAEKEWGRKRQKEHEQILGHLESSALMSPFTSHAHLDMQMQYSFDYCQHVSLPYSSQQRGTLFFRTPRKVQVFGVCCEPLSRQVFFLIDEAEQAGKGALCTPYVYVIKSEQCAAMEWTLLSMDSTLPCAIEWTPPYPPVLALQLFLKDHLSTFVEPYAKSAT
ncbi:hypothetical protein EMCRGX_G029306 [Ephydatia muelleri]